jgi:hypothetical protein
VTLQGRSSLFREEAFEYHFREQESRGVLNTSIRHPWSIALTSMLLLCMALTCLLVAQVEVVYRVEGAMEPTGERLAVAYVPREADINIEPGARVRVELLRPRSSRSQFIDGRVTAVARAPARLEIALDRPVEVGFSPIRIHAVGCRKSLWRFALSPSSGC